MGGPIAIARCSVFGFGSVRSGWFRLVVVRFGSDGFPLVSVGSV